MPAQRIGLCDFSGLPAVPASASALGSGTGHRYRFRCRNSRLSAACGDLSVPQRKLYTVKLRRQLLRGRVCAVRVKK